MARIAVVWLAMARDTGLVDWIAQQVALPCTMVDRIVPAMTPQALQEITDSLVVDYLYTIACEPFRQWVIEDNFVNGRPNWDRVGAQFLDDVVPFEMMKLRMLNDSHSFGAYLGDLMGCDAITYTMTHAQYRQATLALMMQEQVLMLSM